MGLSEFLPGFNASMNGVVVVALIVGLITIRRERKEAHRLAMLVAVGAATLFLAGYMTRLFVSGTHRFPEVGWPRTAYLLILGTHSILAMVSLPLIGRALFLAWRERFAEHRKVVRFAWPIWAYVSMTGVVIYLMLYHLAPRLAAS